MRLEKETAVLRHLYKSVNSRGVVTDRNSAAEYTARLFSRPDIVKNRPDSFGFRAPSPYSGVLEEYNPPDVFVRRVYHYGNNPPNGSYTEVNGVAMSFNRIFGDVITPAANWENSLKQQALRSIKDQKVNLSMTLAFLPQTLKMIRGNFSTIGSVLQSAQRRDWQNVGRLLKVDPKSTSSFYLEVLFGWLQLLRDTQGIVEELHRKCNKPKHTFVYGRAKRSQDVPPIVRTARPYHWTSPGEYAFYGDRSVDHRLVMIYRGETALLSRLSQLGLTNPAELIWDLIPWSWVINMGISIGDFISTLDATIGLTYLGGSYTRYTECRGPVVVTPTPSDAPARYAWYTSEKQSSTPGFYREMRFDRRVIDDKVDPFVLKNPFGAPIALTAAVIAAVVQRGRKATPQPPSGSTRFIYRRRGTRNLPPITYRP